MENASEAARALIRLRWDKTGKKDRKAVGQMLLASRKRAKALRDAKKKETEGADALDTPMELGK